jgi:hypothetical protein
MALTTGNGIAPYLLTALKDIAGNATPGIKLEPFGFMNLLQSQAKPQILRLDKNGHKKQVQVKYKQRFTKEFTDTAKSCDNINVLPTIETSVDLTSTRQIAIHVADETIASFQEEASRMVSLGQAGEVAYELIDDIMHAANAIMQGVNDDLLTTAVSAIGVNRVTGNNSTQSVNFALDTTNNPLSGGLTKILSDYKVNGGKGVPQIVGSGLFHNFMLQQAAKSADQSGLDTAIMASGVKFYHDLSATTILGSHQIIAYEPDAVQIVEYLEYTGFKAGVKPGASEFGTIMLPMQIGQEIVPVAFDWQLKYNDCPVTVTDGYYGTSLTLDKGYSFILSKQAGLFTIPSNAYRAGDVLAGNRGSYRFTITNS